MSHAQLGMQQQRTESPTVTLTWHVRDHKVSILPKFIVNEALPKFILNESCPNSL